MQPLPFYLKEGDPEAGPVAAAAIRAQLDGAVVSAAARGIAVRGLLVTNPNNPLGTLYRDDTISEMLRWCLDNRMHYIRCVCVCVWGGGGGGAMWVVVAVGGFSGLTRQPALPARQGAGRQLQHQRHDLHARPEPRLRALGRPDR